MGELLVEEHIRPALGGCFGGEHDWIAVALKPLLEISKFTDLQ